MKLVVSDASPLIVIAKSGLIPVLTRLVEEIIIPDAVYTECTVSARTAALSASKALSWAWSRKPSLFFSTVVPA